ncbi:MAG: hypothetical protein RMJ98_08530 [Myxococcales bacterium]|nr:hypothetical protein [Polyangiaceae bacterium]MDW8249333.1 hypothetical protein [Myxococcales bacterium]
MPLEIGDTKPATRVATTAASAALPPRLRHAAAARVAACVSVATAPRKAVEELGGIGLGGVAAQAARSSQETGIQDRTLERVRAKCTGSRCLISRDQGTLTVVASDFDQRSLRVLLVFLVIGVTTGWIWREYVSFSLEDLDWLLGACWVGMVGLAIYRVELRRDGMLAAVALAGGALIEAWGTRSGLWTYFSREQPPLFILPAWPAAALATERVVWGVDRGTPPRLPVSWASLYTAVLLAFAAALASWTHPGWHHPLTWVAWLCVLLTAVSGDTADRRADLMRFAAGTLVGFPLEYWGTSRGCWTYWSGEVPPPIAVLSHGFATLAFARGVHLLQLLQGSKTERMIQACAHLWIKNTRPAQPATNPHKHSINKGVEEGIFPERPS